MKFEPQCKTRADLHREWARVLDMCEDAGVNDPSDCVRFMDKVALPDPSFNERPTTYEFALAIVEGNPVFRGDVLYCTDNNCHVCKANGTTKFIAGVEPFDPNKCTWNPPKPKTITINGVEVKVPNLIGWPYAYTKEKFTVHSEFSSKADAEAFKAALEGRK